MHILCGDVGGTNTRLALWADGRLQHERQWPSGGFPGIEAPVERWISETGVRPDRASFAVAGPVRDQRCVTTNLPWVVDGSALTALLGCPTRVINDFHAAARGCTLLGAQDRVQIGGGEPVPGAPIAVLGAGTGLGEAFLVGETVIPGEGGHCELGPTDARELGLASWLIERFGRASWEHVLSGAGLTHLARYIHVSRGEPEPDWDPSQVVERCPEAVEWFCALYGAEAGNMALRVLARGGVYLCGGIAPRIVDRLGAGEFRRRFEAKGKLRAAIRDIPAFVVTHPALGLLGAAAEGMTMRD